MHLHVHCWASVWVYVATCGGTCPFEFVLVTLLVQSYGGTGASCFSAAAGVGAPN